MIMGKDRKNNSTETTAGSFSRNLWMIGGSVAALGSYAAYRYFAPQDEQAVSAEQDANLVSNIIIPTITSALVTIPALLALAMRDHQFRAPLSVAIVMEGAGMLPIVNAWKPFKKPFEPVKRFIHSADEKIGQNFRHLKEDVKQNWDHLKKHVDQEIRHVREHLDQDLRHFKDNIKHEWDDFREEFKEVYEEVKRKAEQSYDHLEAKFIQAYEHQKNYETLFDWLDAFSDKVDRAIPNELKPLLSGAQLNVNTNGDTTRIAASYHGGPEKTLWTSDEPVPVVPANSFLDIVEYTKPHAPYDPRIKEAEDAANEAVIDFIDETVGDAILLSKRALSTASTGFYAHERFDDERYRNEPTLDRTVSMLAGTATESATYAAAYLTGKAVLRFKSAGVGAAALAARPADMAGDYVQDLCHSGFRKFRNATK
jgi:hypothetical protein